MSMDAKTKKQKQVRKRHSDEFKAGAVAHHWLGAARLGEAGTD